MSSESIFQILLVRAVEETDPQGERMPFSVREEATAKAMEISPAPVPGAGDTVRPEHWKFLACRAERLASLAGEISGLPAHAPAWRGGMVLALGLVFILGAMTHAIGLSHAFHLFAGPFLVLLVWNIVVVLWLVTGRFKRGGGKAGAGGRMLAWWLERGVVKKSGGREVATRFLIQWSDWAWTWIVPRAGAFFHAASLCFASGLVLAVYFRGLSVGYVAAWDSTWLDAGQVGKILGTLLRPASMLTGIPLPADTAAWEALRFPSGQGGVPAGPWIHLHAVTLGLFAGLPRLLLMLTAMGKAGAAEKRPPAWPKGDAYLRRVMGPATQRGAVGVAVLGYGFKSHDLLGRGRYRDCIEHLARDVWGARAGTLWLEPVDYGGTPEWGPTGDPHSAPDALLLLFDARATPEEEIHGPVLEAATGRGFVSGVVVALEMAGFPEERQANRIATWKTLVQSRGYQLLAIDHGNPLAADAVPSDHLRIP